MRSRSCSRRAWGSAFFNAIGFNFQQTEAIEAWLPLFLFSILFGLSMDYHVFLLSRIREEYDKTHDNTEAVAYGLRTTAGIITGAAIIMVTVFIGFALGRLGPFQQMGFGLAVAVFLDATIVRTLLVPASMRLLGDLNWYLPKWLEWLPKLNVEGHEPERVIVPDTPAELVEAGEPGSVRASSDSRASVREPGAGLLALELPEDVAGDPSSGRGRHVQDPIRLLDGRSVERAVPLPDLPERP